MIKLWKIYIFKISFFWENYLKIIMTQSCVFYLGWNTVLAIQHPETELFL